MAERNQSYVRRMAKAKLRLDETDEESDDTSIDALESKLITALHLYKHVHIPLGIVNYHEYE